MIKRRRLVRDSSIPIEDLLIKTDNKYGITLDHAIDDIKRERGYNDPLFGDNEVIDLLMRRFDLEFRDVIRVLNYKFDGLYLKDSKFKDSEPEYTYEFDYSTDWEGFDKSYEEEVKDMSMQAEEYGCNLVDWKKLKGVPNCNIRIKVKGTKEKLKRLFRDLGIEDWDSFNKKLIKVRDEEPITYYGLFQRGGSIGANANAEYRRYGDGILLEVYLDREEAKAKAKRYRKSLTPGERSYYGMGYSVKPLNKSELKNPYVQKLIAELDKGTRFNDSIGEVPEENKKALEEFTEWEGIIGYDDDIVDVYESGCAYVDGEYIDYEDSYDALDAYLEWEGILGYTDAIYNILKHGYDSVYYDDMVADRDSYDE